MTFDIGHMTFDQLPSDALRPASGKPCMDYRAFKNGLESLNRLETVARERVGVVLRDMVQRKRTPLDLVEREEVEARRMAR